MTFSPAQSPSIDINDLNFDTCQRLRHLEWLLGRLEIADDALILDVGGYPCYMARAFPRRRIVTADMYAKGHAPYVKASGAALPFSDNTFAVTVACDVLEHVPSHHRSAFLSELARVSSKAVVVAGPYTTPGTARAELMVRQLLPESSPAQTWLAEHAECGLPSLNGTVRTLEAAETEVQILPVGTLTEWMLFFAAQAAGERDHRIAGAMGNFIARFNKLHTVSQSSFKTPAYRHAVVAARNPETRALLSQVAASSLGSADQIIDGEDTQMNGYVDSLGKVFEAAFFRSESTGKGGGGGESDSVRAEYVVRLEKMLAHRGVEASPQTESGRMLSFSQRLQSAWGLLRNGR